MPGLARKEITRLLDHIQPQGVNVTRTKKGYLLRFPDGGTAMVHHTTSDVRQPIKLRADLRRHGITWPTDPPVRKRPSKETIRRGLQAWEALGRPDVVRTRELAMAGGWQERTGSAAVKNWLTWAGFEMVGSTNAARWVLGDDPRPELGLTPAPAPEEPVAPITELHPETEPDPEPAPEAPAPPAPAPEEEPSPEAPAAPGEAWAVWEDLPGTMTVDEVRLMLLAFGLDATMLVRRAAGSS